MFKSFLSTLILFALAIAPSLAHAEYLSLITEARITWSTDFIDTIDGIAKTRYFLDVYGSFSDVVGEVGDHIAVRALGGDWEMLPNTGKNQWGSADSAGRGFRHLEVYVPRSGVVEVKVCMDSDLTHPCSEPVITSFLPEAGMTASSDISRDNPTVHLRVAHFVQAGYTDYILRPTDADSVNYMVLYRGATTACNDPEGYCDLTFPKEQLPSDGPYYLQFINQLGMSGQPLSFTLWSKPQVTKISPAVINTMADTTVLFQFDHQFAAPTGSATVKLLAGPCSGKVLPLNMVSVIGGQFTLPASCLYNSLTATSIPVEVSNPGGTVQVNVPMFIGFHPTPGPHPFPPPVLPGK